jgi:hypothetical protein
MLLHAGGNAVVNYYPIGGVAGATSTEGLGSIVAVVLAFAALLLVVYGPKQLAPAGRSNPAEPSDR